MDTQTETQRENETFEAGVKAYFDYIDANTEDSEKEAYEVWREWAQYHREMAFDAQTEARRRWSAAQ